MSFVKFNLKNKKILITGAAGLLGAEHAKALLECNAKLILTDIDKRKLNMLKKELDKTFESNLIYTFEMDVTSEDSIKNV